MFNLFFQNGGMDPEDSTKNINTSQTWMGALENLFNNASNAASKAYESSKPYLNTAVAEVSNASKQLGNNASQTVNSLMGNHRKFKFSEKNNYDNNLEQEITTEYMELIEKCSELNLSYEHLITKELKLFSEIYKEIELFYVPLVEYDNLLNYCKYFKLGLSSFLYSSNKKKEISEILLIFILIKVFEQADKEDKFYFNNKGSLKFNIRSLNKILEKLLNDIFYKKYKNFFYFNNFLLKKLKKNIQNEIDKKNLDDLIKQNKNFISLFNILSIESVKPDLTELNLNFRNLNKNINNFIQKNKKKNIEVVNFYLISLKLLNELINDYSQRSVPPQQNIKNDNWINSDSSVSSRSSEDNDFDDNNYNLKKKHLGERLKAAMDELRSNNISNTKSSQQQLIPPPPPPHHQSIPPSSQPNSKKPTPSKYPIPRVKTLKLSNQQSNLFNSDLFKEGRAKLTKPSSSSQKEKTTGTDMQSILKRANLSNTGESTIISGYNDFGDVDDMSMRDIEEQYRVKTKSEKEREEQERKEKKRKENEQKAQIEKDIREEFETNIIKHEVKESEIKKWLESIKFDKKEDYVKYKKFYIIKNINGKNFKTPQDLKNEYYNENPQISETKIPEELEKYFNSLNFHEALNKRLFYESCRGKNISLKTKDEFLKAYNKRNSYDSDDDDTESDWGSNNNSSNIILN